MSDRRPSNAVHNRRRVLKLGAGVVATGGLAMLGSTPALAAALQRALSFHNLHTGESLDVTYWADGHHIPDALAEVNHILRDFRTEEVWPIDVRLLDVLHRLRHSLDTAEPFHIISGYRSPATNKKLRNNGSGVAKRSLHMQGKAIDVRVPGRSVHTLHKAAVAMKAGGVGKYPKSGFVHMDVGRVRYW
jgi:uncharacterized protein YcbK (DUF882 family)